MGVRTYCSAAPSLWNALPDHLRTPPTVDALDVASKPTFLTEPLVD